MVVFSHLIIELCIVFIVKPRHLCSNFLSLTKFDNIFYCKTAPNSQQLLFFDQVWQHFILLNHANFAATSILYLGLTTFLFWLSITLKENWVLVLHGTFYGIIWYKCSIDFKIHIIRCMDAWKGGVGRMYQWEYINLWVENIGIIGIIVLFYSG